jgi:peptide/nickel transport system substrate-binding protein
MNTRWTVSRRFVISFFLVLVAVSAPGRTRPHYGGTLHVEIEGDPWARPDGMAWRLVLDGLTEVDTGGNVQPALAIDWKPENNAHRWQFHLRPGVQFQDGTSVTSMAVVESLSALCRSKCPWSEMRALGSTVVFLSDAPLPQLPAVLAGNGFLISRAPNNTASAGAIGTGPFQVSSFANGTLSLTANPNCWSGRPFVDTIEIRIHRPVQDQWMDLSLGRADVVEVPAEQLRQAQQQRMHIVESPEALLLLLHVEDEGALANPNLRASIALAIDRTALSNVIFQKAGQVTASLLPQSLSGYAFLFPADRDLNKAHELRGGLSPPPIMLQADNSRSMQLVAQRIALNLREAGFNVQVAAPNAPHPNLSLREVLIPNGDPSAVLDGLIQNLAHSAAPGGDDAASLYKSEREFLAAKTWIPLLDLPRAYAVSSRVRDLESGADGLPDLANASITAPGEEAAR